MENILAENMRRFRTKNLSEQNITNVFAVFRLPSSKQLYIDFVTKYAKDKLNFTDDLTIKERIAIIQRSLSNDSLINDTAPIQYFRSLGYKEKDPRIQNFQKEFGIEKIKTLSGKTAPFVDGDFGAGTVKAALSVLLSRQQDLLSSYDDDTVYKTTLATPQQQQAAKDVPVTVQPPRSKTTQQLNIGTQSTQ
jgi:hypothetical protein